MSARRIRTERLTLKRLSLFDAAFVFRLASNPETRRYLGGVQPLLRRLAHMPRYWDGHAVWCVIHEGALGRVGIVSLSNPRAPAAMELSYQFRPEVWGRGLATEACAAALDHVDRSTDAHRVFAETQEANAASRRLLKRLGFAEIAEINRHGAPQVICERQSMRAER